MLCAGASAGAEHLSRPPPSALGPLRTCLREQVDAEQGWGLLPRDRAEYDSAVGTRCAEYHTMLRGGSLPEPQHHDAGSLLTIDLLLARPGVDFQGGVFQTLEAATLARPDGWLRPQADFAMGDAIVFQSHKCAHARHGAGPCARRRGREGHAAAPSSVTSARHRAGGRGTSPPRPRPRLPRLTHLLFASPVFAPLRSC